MKYMGSKNRIAKHILPIMLKERKEGQYWVEPFVGGANMIDKVDGLRIGADINRYLICTLKELSRGWLPPKELNKEVYLDIKNNISKYPAELVGYAGFQLSYGSLWFGSYRRDNIGKRKYDIEAYKNIVKQSPKLKNIDFKCCNYKDLHIPKNSLIYCDPPYQGTAKYTQNEDDFNHTEFWEWCREMSKKGHTVFISEYNAPDDFECIWEQELRNGLNKKKATEKLFKCKH